MRAALELRQVSHSWRGRDPFGREPPTRALVNVSLLVAPGECVGLIGGSGSGKSTLAALSAGLLPLQEGGIWIGGEPMPATPGARSRSARGRLQIVFQNPFSALDPTFTVASAIAEGPAIHRLPSWRSNRQAHVAALLAEVGLEDTLADRRPHELSGGQRQRVAIARALAVDPEMIVLDEPTSALDVSIQAQILNLLLATQASRGAAFLLISHDLAVIRHMAERVYVMQDGRIVESGETASVLGAPAHPYTRQLVSVSHATQAQIERTSSLPRTGATP